MTHSPLHFAEELDALTGRLLEMVGLAEDRLRAAVGALVEGNRDQLDSIIIGDVALNDLQVAIDHQCFRLLALYQPVAVDLRTIVSTIRISADLERIGDLAVNIAEAAQRYFTHPPVKPLIDIPRMGQLALTMLRESTEAFIRRDVQLAYGVLRQDAWMDALQHQVLRELLTYMMGNAQTIAPSVELVLISRHLKRVGEHATNFAEDVVFIVEARDIRHRTSAAEGDPARGPERRRNFGDAPA